MARSLAGDVALQEKLLKGEPLATREAALAYRALVGENGGLRRALEECRAKGDMGPLRAYREAVKADGEEAARVVRVFEVLGLERRRE